MTSSTGHRGRRTALASCSAPREESSTIDPNGTDLGRHGRRCRRSRLAAPPGRDPLEPATPAPRARRLPRPAGAGRQRPARAQPHPRPPLASGSCSPTRNSLPTSPSASATGTPRVPALRTCGMHVTVGASRAAGRLRREDPLQPHERDARLATSPSTRRAAQRADGAPHRPRGDCVGVDLDGLPVRLHVVRAARPPASTTDERQRDHARARSRTPTARSGRSTSCASTTAAPTRTPTPSRDNSLFMTQGVFVP